MADRYPGGDAADLVYPGAWSGHTFTNESTQSGPQPARRERSLRDYWEEGSAGWISYMGQIRHGRYPSRGTT